MLEKVFGRKDRAFFSQGPLQLRSTWPPSFSEELCSRAHSWRGSQCCRLRSPTKKGRGANTPDLFTGLRERLISISAYPEGSPSPQALDELQQAFHTLKSPGVRLRKRYGEWPRHLMGLWVSTRLAGSRSVPRLAHMDF